MRAARAPTVGHPVASAEDVMNGDLPVGEGLIVQGDAPLNAVAPRPRPWRDGVLGVLYVVGGHELVHCRYIALGPHLLEEPVNWSLVILCGHSMPSSSSR